MVEIGKIYKVRLQSQHLMHPVSGASDILTKEYPLYGDLQSKEVMVMAKASGTNVKAGLIEKGRPLEGYWFTISSLWLVPINNGPCNCDLKMLMCRGCQCGAFDSEKTTKNKQQDTKVIFTPW